MPILSTGCRSGLVVDIGYEEIRSIAVCWGRPLLPTLKGTKLVFIVYIPY